jgi:hypothetical protein
MDLADTLDFNLDTRTIRHGYALVFINKEFRTNGSWLPNRPGAEMDKKFIEQFCRNAGCTIAFYENLSAESMKLVCKYIAMQNFSSHDAFICFVSSHGDTKGIVYGVDGASITFDDVISPFKGAGTLVGKPKLFFLQNCRGTMVDRGVEIPSSRDAPPTSRRVPTEADILVAHSSSDGYESYRNINDGSWFFIKLMEVLKEHARDMQLTDMLTLVNREVASQDADGRRQMPYFTTSLTEAVYFNISGSSESQPSEIPISLEL